jgi:CRP-like cAMP-binding protein
VAVEAEAEEARASRKEQLRQGRIAMLTQRLRVAVDAVEVPADTRAPRSPAAKEQLVGQLRPPAAFGELALLEPGGLRAATVYASAAAGTTLVRLSRGAFESSVQALIKAETDARIATLRNVKAFNHAFGSWSQERLLKLSNYLQPFESGRGAVLALEGQPCKTVYLVTGGTVRVTQQQRPPAGGGAAAEKTVDGGRRSAAARFTPRPARTPLRQLHAAAGKPGATEDGRRWRPAAGREILVATVGGSGGGMVGQLELLGCVQQGGSSKAEAPTPVRSLAPHHIRDCTSSHVPC